MNFHSDFIPMARKLPAARRSLKAAATIDGVAVLFRDPAQQLD